MSSNSSWIEKVIDNRNLFTHLLLSLVCFLLGIGLFVSGLVKHFPPVNPYGYALSSNEANIIIVTGIVFIIMSVVLYILGTRNTHVNEQQIRGGISYLYLRQYLLSRVNIKSDIINKLGDLPTPKSITDITYLLKESSSEIILLKSVNHHLLLLLEDESDPSISEEIIEIIGKTRMPNTDKILIDYYKKNHYDDHFDILLKAACLRALGEFGTSKARKALEKILENPHKLPGNLLNATNRSMKKILVLSEYIQLLKSQLFDERIDWNIRETYILSTLEQIGTDDAITILKAYQLSKLEGVDVDSAYEQITSKRKEEK